MEHKTFKIKYSDNLTEKAETIYEYIQTNSYLMCLDYYLNTKSPEVRVTKQEVYEEISKWKKPVIEEILSLMHERVSRKDIFFQIKGKVRIWLKIFSIYTNITVYIAVVSYDSSNENFYIRNSTADKDFQLFLYDNILYKKYKAFVGRLKLLTQFEGYKFPPRYSRTQAFYSKYNELKYDIFGNLLIVLYLDEKFVLISTKNSYTILNGRGVDISTEQSLLDYVLDILNYDDEIDLPNDIYEEIEKHKLLHSL